mmetsp:Transcript_5939/g.26282  ORF Transcript_5939/g.26282 Transcript_5939/m.26282 type:complete len:237 (-) Transcript_5939:879-1589(-)
MPRARRISRTSSLTSLARVWRVRSSAPRAFLAAASSEPFAASAAARSRDSISPSASSKTSGLGTTNMHRCMPVTTAHADTVSVDAAPVADASTGTRPKRKTVPGCAMSSCASTRKNGSVSSASRGRDPSGASCAGAASTCTSPPAEESSKTAAHPSAAASRVDAAATAAPEAVTPAAGGRTVVSLRMPPDFFAAAAAAAGLGGSSSSFSSSSSSSIGTAAGASSASIASPSSRWPE